MYQKRKKELHQWWQMTMPFCSISPHSSLWWQRNCCLFSLINQLWSNGDCKQQGFNASFSFPLPACSASFPLCKFKHTAPQDALGGDAVGLWKHLYSFLKYFYLWICVLSLSRFPRNSSDPHFLFLILHSSLQFHCAHRYHMRFRKCFVCRWTAGQHRL